MKGGDMTQYWLLPFVRENPMDPKSNIRAHVFKHAGDTDNFLLNHQGKPLR
jgi:hypothetical protein